MWLAGRWHGDLGVDPVGGREAEKGGARVGDEKVVAACVADDGADDGDGTVDVSVGVEQQGYVVVESAWAVGVGSAGGEVPWAVASLTWEPCGEGACFAACGCHDEDADAGIDFCMEEDDVVDEDLSGVASGRVDDADAGLVGVLAYVLEGRYDVALPRGEGAADDFLEVVGVVHSVCVSNVCFACKDTMRFGRLYAKM